MTSCAKENPVSDAPNAKDDLKNNGELGFLASLSMGIMRDLVKFIIAFVVGTGAGAIVCWYYGVPLVFSLAGGILVLGLALALSTDSLFS